MTKTGNAPPKSSGTPCLLNGKNVIGRRMPEAPALILGLPFPARGEGRPLGGFATPNVMVLQIQWLMGSNRDRQTGRTGTMELTARFSPMLLRRPCFDHSAPPRPTTLL
jgi:hypothetical protein